MCITASVGRNGRNVAADVKTVQLLLNFNIGEITPLPVLPLDGRVSTPLFTAIEEFQRRVVETPQPDGRVDPNGMTLAALRKGIPEDFTSEKLRGIMINASPDLIRTYFTPIVSQMAANEVNTPLRISHFLAQLGHESGELRFSEELASGAAYEGRLDLGNTQPGDGVRFKGRGLIQITGRANYTEYGNSRGENYIDGDNPKKLATDPKIAVDSACWFWNKKNLNALADVDDVLTISIRINGRRKDTGLPNGLDDRVAKLKRAKFFLNVEPDASNSQ